MESQTISVTLSGGEIAELLKMGVISLNEARLFIGLPPVPMTQHTHDGETHEHN